SCEWISNRRPIDQRAGGGLDSLELVDFDSRCCRHFARGNPVAHQHRQPERTIGTRRRCRVGARPSRMDADFRHACHELSCGRTGRRPEPYGTSDTRQWDRTPTLPHRPHHHSNRRTKHSAGHCRVLQLPFRRMGFNVMSYFLVFFAVLLQSPSLDSASPKERQAAVEQMAVLGNREAIPKLAAALKREPKSEVRASIVAALGRIRDREAIPVLADTLRTDLEKDVRSQAIDSLLRLYIPIDDSGPLRTIFSRVKSVFFEANPPVIGPEVQVDASVKDALAAAMQKDFSDEVRAQAARALGTLKARDQVPVLVATLEDPQNREHRNVRLEVVRTLGMIRDPAAGPALERALRDPNKQIQEEAILAIGLVAYTPARATLEQFFRTESDRRIKSRSLEALSLLRDAGNTKLFESLLNDSNDTYRELAAEGLARLHYDASGWKDRFDQEKKENVRNALAFVLA